MSELAPCWEAYANKLAFRADSILTQLTDEEFASGLAAVKRYAAGQARDEPVVEPVDFFVFRRT
jgi:hypothetical protein